MKIFSQDLLMTMQHTNAIMVTITVVKKKYVGSSLEPANDATCVLTAQGYSQVGDTITVPAGTKVHCVTSLTNYNSDDQYIVAYDNTTIEVRLNNRTEYLFTLNLTPAVSCTLVCLDENDVPTGRTSTTGSMLVPENYKVRAELQNPDQFTINQSEYIWTVANAMTVNRTLKATVTFGTLIPSDAQHEFSIDDNTFTTPNYNNSITLDCTSRLYWRVSKPGFVTQTGEIARSGSPAYFTNQTLPTKTLSPETRHFTATCTSPADATVTVTVNGISYTDTGSKTVDCIIGDVITWSMQRAAYESKSGGPITMNTEDLSVSTYLNALYCYVTVTSTPPQATVQILRGAEVIASGTGSATATCIQGEQITYKATYGDQTQQMTVYVPEETSHTYTLTLAGMAGSVTIITSSGQQHLVVGQYKYVAISGAGAGSIGRCHTQTTGVMNGKTVHNYYGGSGGPGGGAGRISVGTFNVTTEQDVYVTVGAGGVSGVNNGKGGTTSLIMSNTTVFSVEGADGGVAPTNVIGTSAGTGGNGTSGGGAGGAGGRTFVGTSVSTTAGTAGARGGLGGYNGEATSTSFTAGTGVLNASGSYESNAGAYVDSWAQDKLNAGRGGGGRGLVSIQSSITPTFINNLNSSNLTQLYNSMGGGGSGGGIFATSYTGYYAPPGGGGGAWSAGSIGVAPVTSDTASTGTGGAGGSGAVILCRINWGE